MSASRIKKTFLSVGLVLCLLHSAYAQDAPEKSDWETETMVNFGCNIFLNYSRTQKFPGARVFGALSLVAVKNNHFSLHYGPSLSIYTKTIGANLNPLVGDIQIDFTNTVSIGCGWDGTENYYKQLRTLHSGDFYNLVTRQRYAAFLSTNFVLNNHRRNQILGSISGTIDNFSFNYNNDGVPFGWMALGDSFDRYWTGGATLFFHNSKGFNAVEFGYDQFTGYQPLLYELANIIGINVPLYDNQRGASGRSKLPNNFNTSVYQLKIGIDQFTSIDIGFVGSMIDKRGKFWGFQDWIHLKGHYPFHPNKDNTRFFVGGSFNHLTAVQP